MIFAFLRIPMDFVKQVRVSQERAETGFGAEIDGPAAIFDAWIIDRVGIAENPSAESDEAVALLLTGKDS